MYSYFLIICLLLVVSKCTAFISHKAEYRKAFFRCNSSVSDNQVATTKVAVNRVNVCMGELCKCQEGDNAEIILADLGSRNLPFVVEDAPCLGACGMGAMVSVEYEDGDYLLVTGLKETLEAIGVQGYINKEVDKIVDIEQNEGNQPVDMAEIPPVVNEINKNDFMSTKDLNTNNNDIQDGASEQDISDSNDIVNIVSPDKNIEDNHDAIKRMRAAAKEDEEKSNPWVNMAMYIGKKVLSKD